MVRVMLVMLRRVGLFKSQTEVVLVDVKKVEEKNGFINDSTLSMKQKRNRKPQTRSKELADGTWNMFLSFFIGSNLRPSTLWSLQSCSHYCPSGFNATNGKSTAFALAWRTLVCFHDHFESVVDRRSACLWWVSVRIFSLSAKIGCSKQAWVSQWGETLMYYLQWTACWSSLPGYTLEEVPKSLGAVLWLRRL